MKAWLVFIFLFSGVAHGKSIWISAVGIDGFILSQNYNEFYTDAVDFLDVCQAAKLNSDVDCHLYMNTDSKYKTKATTTATLDRLKLGNPKPPTPKDVLEDFKNALISAGDGDQVLLSLLDHGGPGLVSHSCIYLDTIHTICERDVQDIIKKYKKPGTKVFISAEGCFSGGFHDLNSDNVCVFAESDRFRLGYSNPNEFWPMVKKHMGNKSLTVADLASIIIPTPNGKGFSSAVIATKLCDDAHRAEIAKKDLPEMVRNFTDVSQRLSGSSNFKKDCSCSTDLKTFRENKAEFDTLEAWLPVNIGALEALAGNLRTQCKPKQSEVCAYAKNLEKEAGDAEILWHKIKSLEINYQAETTAAEKSANELDEKIQSLSRAYWKSRPSAAQEKLSKLLRHSINKKSLDLGDDLLGLLEEAPTKEVADLNQEKLKLLQSNFFARDRFREALSNLEANNVFAEVIKTLNQLVDQCLGFQAAPFKFEDVAYGFSLPTQDVNFGQIPNSPEALRKARDCEAHFSLH